MITIDEAYNTILALNDDAHEAAYDTWSKADVLEDSDNEEDWGRAEDLREDASLEQAEYFREGFDELDQPVKDAILHYVTTDESFREEFTVWYGVEEFEEDFPSK